MLRSEKQSLIESLQEEFSRASAVIVCDYKGLTVKELEELRNSTRPDGIKVQVIKNTFATISLEKAGKEGLDLKGPNIFIWGEEQVTVAKKVTDFAKDRKEKFTVKAGHVDGKVVSAQDIEAISKMPSREQLLGMLLSVWTQPAQMLLSVWSAPARYFVAGLSALKDKKEQEG